MDELTQGIAAEINVGEQCSTPVPSVRGMPGPCRVGARGRVEGRACTTVGGYACCLLFTVKAPRPSQLCRPFIIHSTLPQIQMTSAAAPCLGQKSILGQEPCCVSQADPLDYVPCIFRETGGVGQE